MVVEMCKGSDIGKFTGYYYTASMAAQVVTPIVAGTLMRKIDYRVLFPYAALFVALSFVTMLFVHHGDAKAEARRGWRRSRKWTTDPVRITFVGVDVGIPYRTPANPYCFANFERKAFLPQPFKGSCY